MFKVLFLFRTVINGLFNKKKTPLVGASFSCLLKELVVVANGFETTCQGQTVSCKSGSVNRLGGANASQEFYARTRTLIYAQGPISILSAIVEVNFSFCMPYKKCLRESLYHRRIAGSPTHGRFCIIKGRGARSFVTNHLIATHRVGFRDKRILQLHVVYGTMERRVLLLMLFDF